MLWLKKSNKIASIKPNCVIRLIYNYIDQELFPTLTNKDLPVKKKKERKEIIITSEQQLPMLKGRAYLTDRRISNT